MPFVMRSPQMNYVNVNNKETENFFVSEDDDDDFNFKYVPAEHFKNIVKRVRRQRCKEDEDRVWSKLVHQQDMNGLKLNKDNVRPTMQNVKSLLLETTEEVDRELMRLEEDALPERTKRTYSATAVANNQQIESQDVTPESKPEMKDSGTGSSNILLAIPEEETDYSYERSPEHNKNPKINIRNSSWTYTMRKKRYPKHGFHTADDIDYDSSLELSIHDDSDFDEEIYAQVDPIVAQKILMMQKKVSELLDELLYRLDRIPLPDGEKDLRRRQQRVMEFAIRFSRNYLYDLKRQVSDIRRHVGAISQHRNVETNQRTVVFHVQAIEHKLMSAYQLLLQALTAYCKHIPSSVFIKDSIYQGYPGKLKELLETVMEMKDICNTIQLNTDYFGSGDTNMSPVGKHMEKQCSTILSKLKVSSEKEWQLIAISNNNSNNNNKQETLPITPESTYAKIKRDGKQLANRLSMYSTDSGAAKLNYKKRTNLGQEKERRCGIRNVKTLSMNHMSIMEQPHPSPATESSSKQLCKTKQEKGNQKVHRHEDDIKTMMDLVPADFDNGATSERQAKHDNVTIAKPKFKTKRTSKQENLQLNSMEKNELLKVNSSTNKNDNLVKPGTSITEEELSNLVPVIADLMSLVTNEKNHLEVKPVSSTSVETLMGFLQKYQSPNSSITKMTTSSCQNSASANCECPEPNSTKTICDIHKNTKNMKLICMESTLDIPRYCDASCQANCDNLRVAANSKASSRYNVLTNASSKRNIIPIIISDIAESRLQQWQNEYQNYCQLSPMYSSTTQNKPWDIVAWISDKLVDELIIEIAKELQMDEVIQKLFEMEFQEF